jgi:hypothetical protein
MMRGSTPLTAPARMRAIGFWPAFSPAAAAADHQRGGAVVDPGGVAGSHHAACRQWA